MVHGLLHGVRELGRRLRDRLTPTGEITPAGGDLTAEAESVVVAGFAFDLGLAPDFTTTDNAALAALICAEIQS